MPSTFQYKLKIEVKEIPAKSSQRLKSGVAKFSQAEAKCKQKNPRAE